MYNLCQISRSLCQRILRLTSLQFSQPFLHIICLQVYKNGYGNAMPHIYIKTDASDGVGRVGWEMSVQRISIPSVSKSKSLCRVHSGYLFPALGLELCHIATLESWEVRLHLGRHIATLSRIKVLIGGRKCRYWAHY